MMIFFRPAIPHSPTRDGERRLFLLAGERRRAIALEQHLDLALGLLQLRRSGASKLDAFLERRDRLLQREATPLARRATMSSYFSETDDTAASATRNPLALGAWGFYSFFSSTTCAESSPSCNRTRTRSPGWTCDACSSA